jgi:hypothetical protein
LSVLRTAVVVAIVATAIAGKRKRPLFCGKVYLIGANWGEK